MSKVVNLAEYRQNRPTKVYREVCAHFGWDPDELYRQQAAKRPHGTPAPKQETLTERHQRIRGELLK